MRAAIVTDTSRAPEYGEFPDPEPREGYVEVEVVASAVHVLVRSIAAGRHYSANTPPPFVPGVDGVVRLPDGGLVYSGRPPAPLGMLAERTLVPQGFAVPLPEGLDPETAAVIVNPGVSGWLPLSQQLQPGQTVLVVGATGASGSAAVAVAKALGAGRVVAAGRNHAVLDRLLDRGADAVLELGDDLGPALAHAAEGYDIVLDYLWGTVAEAMIPALIGNGIDPRRPLSWINIGSLAGGTVPLDAAWVRSANLRVSGSGIGSSPPELYEQGVTALLGMAAEGRVTIDHEVHPLSEVSRTWDDPARLVYLP